MDLFVLGTILVVFLVLLIASLLVNKMPSGKTFEQVQAEKKQLADQMKQQSRPGKQKGGGGATSSNSSNKQKAKAEKKGAKAAAKATVKVEEVAEEPHVEFVEEEIYLGDDMPVVKKSLSSTGLNSKQGQSEKSKKSPVEKKAKSGKTGILVNKASAAAPPKIHEPTAPVVEVNHFEEIHPKDDVEMLRANKEEVASSNKGGKPHKNAVNELRKEKKGKNKGDKAKGSSAAVAVPLDVADIEGVEQILKANEQKLQQKRSADSVDSVRGKRAVRTGGANGGLQALQKIVDSTDEISVNVLIMLLSRAELSRSEIQLVIDYLLNKQSDSVAVLNSEWTEGKQDLVARLKKQLAERETQLQNEQEAASAIQEKLKLLRLELNQEKTQNGNTAKMYMWEMAQKEKDMEQLVAKVNAAGTEKAALLAQMQKMQVTLVQQKNAMGSAEEHQRQVQQLQEANATLQRELELFKSSVQVGQVDMRNLQNELDSARNEILQQRQKGFEVSEQMNRDVQVLSGQVTSLKVDLANYEQVLAEKQKVIDKFEADQEQNKGAEESLFRQLEEQKKKNNDLESQVQERVQQAEKELKDKFTQLLHQISAFSNLKVDNGSNHSTKANGDSSNGAPAELDEWMTRVAAELKKKFDVFEGLVKTMRQQLQEQREKELMSVGTAGSGGVGGGAKSSTKFVAEANGDKNGNGQAAEQEAESNGNGQAEVVAT